MKGLKASDSSEKEVNFAAVFLIIICVLSPAVLHAQKENRLFKNQVKFSPLRLIDFVNPGIELGYERRFSNSFSTELSGAYMICPVPAKQFNGYKGYRFSIGPKYFLEPTEYLSPEFVHHKVKFDEVMFGYDSAGNILQPADSFTIRKKTISINIRYGKQFYFNHFMIDLAFGLGFKYRNVHHEGRTVEYFRPRHPNIYFSAKEPRKDWTMNFPIQFKIGYRF